MADSRGMNAENPSEETQGFGVLSEQNNRPKVVVQKTFSRKSRQHRQVSSCKTSLVTSDVQQKLCVNLYPIFRRVLLRWVQVLTQIIRAHCQADRCQ